MQIRKGGAREPENPCRDNGTVPGGEENGSVQRAGASAEEKGKGTRVLGRGVGV